MKISILFFFIFFIFLFLQDFLILLPCYNIEGNGMTEWWYLMFSWQTFNNIQDKKNVNILDKNSFI